MKLARSVIVNLILLVGFFYTATAWKVSADTYSCTITASLANPKETYGPITVVIKNLSDKPIHAMHDYGPPGLEFSLPRSFPDPQIPANSTKTFTLENEGGEGRYKIWAEKYGGVDVCSILFYASPPLCGYLPENSEQKKKCNNCLVNQGIWTSIGCITTDPKQFIPRLLEFATGIAGGIAFLLIIFGGFGIMTSSGNPEKLNAGKELVSSAIAGLLLIIFSLFILQLIGYNILGIPGFK